MKIYRYNDKCNICGLVIRDLRRKKHLTQNELAAKMQVMGIDVEQTAISRIETGNRVVADYELRAFANVFGVKMEDLMEEEVRDWK